MNQQSDVAEMVRVKIMAKAYDQDYTCLECGKTFSGRQGLLVSLLPCGNRQLTEVFICSGCCSGELICREQVFDLNRYNKADGQWPYA